VTQRNTAVKRGLSLPRVAMVTAGLIGGGAIAGGIAGVIGAAVWIGLQEGFRTGFDLQVVLLPGVIGAPLGAVMLPVAGFTVLRFVPLGRVLVTTVLGTALGGVIGTQFFSGRWFGGALVGFAAAAVWR